MEERRKGGKKKKGRRKIKEWGKRKEKGRKERKGGKKKGEEENRAWRRKKRKRKGLRFPEFQRLKVVSLRIKVCPREGSYAWVLETPSFVAFQKVGVSPTLVISCLVAIVRAILVKL